MLGRESEMKDFIESCSEPFTMFVSASVVASSPAMELVPSTSNEHAHSASIDHVPSTSFDPVPSTSFDPVPSNSNDERISTPTQAMNVPRSVRSSRGLTPRKLRLKRHFEFTSNLRSEERKWYIGRVKQLNRWEDDVPRWYNEMGIPMTDVNNWVKERRPILYPLEADGRRVRIK